MSGRIHDERTAAERDRAFLPGMGRAWLLPLYDVFTRVGGVHRLHARAVELAGVAPGQTVLDVGCGTGNLALAVLAVQPTARVTGLDPDGDALRRAGRKARRRGLRLELVQGFADRVPVEDGSVDHLVSALALHHVDDGSREGFAREARRVLRPGGTVTIVDVGGGLHGHDHGPDHDRGRGRRHGWRRPRLQDLPVVAPNRGDGIPALLRAAGLVDAREVDHTEHRFGRITFVQATR